MCVVRSIATIGPCLSMLSPARSRSVFMKLSLFAEKDFSAQGGQTCTIIFFQIARALISEILKTCKNTVGSRIIFSIGYEKNGLSNHGWPFE